jgi:hypothetical protein
MSPKSTGSRRGPAARRVRDLRLAYLTGRPDCPRSFPALALASRPITASARTRRSATRFPSSTTSPRRGIGDGVLSEPAYGAEHALLRVRHNGEIEWRAAQSLSAPR